MNLQINIEELRKKKLFVATPMYGGMNHGMYAKSLLDLHTICIKYGIEMRSSFIFNESLITRARNYLVDEFLRSEEYTHMLFLDSDIHFEANDVIAMLALDKEVVGAPYPKKSIKWDNVREVALKHKDISPSDLEKVVGDYVFNPAPGVEKFSVGEPIEVLELGTGFMMIKRGVFEKHIAAYGSATKFTNNIGLDPKYDKYLKTYFDTAVRQNRYYSEDWTFCENWRDLGGRIWVDKRVLLRHSGSYVFCQENQQYLMDNIGPMYVEAKKAQEAQAAQTLQPDANGNVTLPTT